MNVIEKIQESAINLENDFLSLVEQLDKSSKGGKNVQNIKPIHKILDKYQKLKKLIEKQNERFEVLKRTNERLQKKNDTIISDNYLLEYKKKDLLVLADELEDANEQIAKKNKEITEQSDELEAQKDAIQDQADYLHEINERITTMHMELQTQRDEIWAKNEELVSLNNEKNNLIGIVAHDLKSPLNQIGGLITLLKLTAELEDEPAEFVNTMSESVNRLNGMIEKILDVEAIESKKLNLNIERVDLVGVLESLTQNYTLTAKEKDIQLISSVELDKAMASVDASFVNQIYENLISNSIKFSPPKKKIFISLTEVEGKWRCEIKDEGPGISEEDQTKLFGKFQKLSARPTGNETSTGLGLSIVKKYVDAMDGKIWCESQLNKGASFIVEFDKENKEYNL